MFEQDDSQDWLNWQEPPMQRDYSEAFAFAEAERQRAAKPTIPQLQQAFDEAEQRWRKLDAERSALMAEWQEQSRVRPADERYSHAQQRMAYIRDRAGPLESDLRFAAQELAQKRNALLLVQQELRAIQRARASLRPDPATNRVHHRLSRLQALAEDRRLAAEQRRLEGR